MKPLSEIRDMIDAVQPTKWETDRICSILAQLVEHIEAIERSDPYWPQTVRAGLEETEAGR